MKFKTLMKIFLPLASIAIGASSAFYIYSAEFNIEHYSQLLMSSNKPLTQNPNVNPNANVNPNTNTSLPLSSKHHLDVPLINQKPELNNGCEVTSLAMILNYKGIGVDKLELASVIPKDLTPLNKDASGKIISWGNPLNGFVGDVAGKSSPGYSVDPLPLMPIIEHYYPRGAADLTNASLEDLQYSIFYDNPIIVWVTTSMNVPSSFISWTDSLGNAVKASFSQHTVVLTGYDENYFYYNDPLSNKKNLKISKDQFSKVWEAMGKKALSVK